LSAVLARELALDIAERVGRADEVMVKRFFGGAALLAAGLQFGFVMKGSLYLRTDDTNRAAFEAMGAAPFRYAGAGRTVTVQGYFEAPAEIVEDSERLRVWVERARHAAMIARDANGSKKRAVRRL
jgi:DNA transformation protein